MIGTTGATVLAVISILFAGLLGLGVGGLTCLILRRPWSLKAAAIDSAVATVVFIAGALIDMAIGIACGILESHETLILFIAASSAAAREMIRSIRR